MNPVAAVGCGMAAALAVEPRWRVRTAGIVAAVGVAPLPGTALLAAGWLLGMRNRLRLRRRRRAAADADVPRLAELLSLAMAGGLTVRQALERAVPRLHPDIAAEVRSVLRQAHAVGLAGALSSARGRARALWLRMARALVTGAPLGDSLTSFVAAARHEERMTRAAAFRRLPVKLMVPVALLILPGFVVLTLGPALLGALEELSLPLAPGRLPG